MRSQEASHKGQTDKLELDLQRHRNMLQGVLLRIREESEECAELGAPGNVLQLLKVPWVKLFVLLSVILSKCKGMTCRAKPLLRKCTSVL